MTSQIISYLSHVGEFFVSQKKLLPENMLGDSIGAMHANVKKQIQNLKTFEPAEATALNTAIHKSAFPQHVKAELALLVTKQLCASNGDDESGKGQHLLHPFNYCTKSDVAYFEDLMKTQQQVAVKMRQCMNRVDCIRPSERTFAAMASMIACLRDPTMTSVALHALVLDIKQAMPTPSGIATKIHNYPESSLGLSDELWKRAYAAEPPISVSLPAFNEIYNRCPKRKSHAAVKVSSSASPTPDISHSGLTGAGIQSMIESFAKKFIENQVVKVDEPRAIAGGSSKDACQIVRTDDRFRSQTSAGAQDGLMALVGDSDDDAGNDADTMVDDNAADADDIIKQMESVAAGSIVKRPAASLKRPASGDSAVLKRPVMKASTKTKKLLLGCSRCRGSKTGCSKCRSPAFTGRRFRVAGK